MQSKGSLCDMGRIRWDLCLCENLFALSGSVLHFIPPKGAVYALPRMFQDGEATDHEKAASGDVLPRKDARISRPRTAKDKRGARSKDVLV